MLKSKKMLNDLNEYFAAEEQNLIIPPIEKLNVYKNFDKLYSLVEAKPVFKRSRAFFVRAALFAACLTAVIAAVAAVPALISKRPANTVSPDNSGISTESDISRADDTTSPTDHSEVIYMLVPEEIPNGEFAGDMYRPDGYSKNICSALALKLEYSNDKSQTFSVVIDNRNKATSFEQIIANVNRALDDIIDITMISKVEIKNGRNGNSENMYFAKINAEQIIALADNGIVLGYVGSGVGNLKDMNWDTPEGINTFCELNGDMMIFKGDEIVCYPDVYDE